MSVGGSKAAHFRAEIYNLFDQVEFQDIDRTARFDATGVQIKRERAPAAIPSRGLHIRGEVSA